MYTRYHFKMCVLAAQNASIKVFVKLNKSNWDEMKYLKGLPTFVMVVLL